MKERSRRTARRDGKRIERKRVRAADRDALRGARPRLVRSPDWAGKSHLPDTPEEGEHVPGAKPSRRREKDGYWCPAREGRKRHHYLTERVKRHARYFGVLGGEHWYEHKLCAYCGKETWRLLGPD